MAQNSKYVINGVISGNYNADKVYLISEEFINGPQKTIDSSLVNQGRFKFEGQTPEYSVIHFIKSADSTSRTNLTPVFLEPGNINVTVSAEHFYHNASVTGTANNLLLTQYSALVKNVMDSVLLATSIDWTINGRDDKKEQVEFPRRTKLINKRNLDIQREMVSRYNNQVFAPFMIYWEMRRDLPPSDLTALYNQLDPKLSSHPYTILLKDFISASSFAVGNQMPDFSLPNHEGKEVKWNEFKGKYVLIDFWASWCGPCLREMPNIVKLYEECKDKNFEIIGITVDDNKDKWLKAIKENNMTWTQLGDMKAWDSHIVKLCNVSAVPYTVLIDPTGKVIALDLRGEELIKKVKELVTKK
ncbi:AhpC/TSA family protein [Sphingobacterium sp. WQ 366]|uniref:AhpC/TSA family protein n=2 Tax=Sphingobacterium bovistauri TaxID=2781959 RepID=A0ABS7Z440_9SPHI|nr:AhpC/TSA family protein [Sphingobacterium bovistauri]